MYRIIAYHGKERNNEVEKDLGLLWDSLSNFAKQREIEHIYCFQAVRDGEEANLLLVVQYRDNVAAKLALPNEARRALQTHNHVDYWFYVREDNQVNKRRTLS